jgi:hypothetical protein
MNQEAWKVVKVFRDTNFPTWYGKTGGKSLDDVPVLQDEWAAKMSSPPMTTQHIIRRTYAANVCVQTGNVHKQIEEEHEKERERERDK